MRRACHCHAALHLPSRPAVALLHHYAYPAAEASFWVLTAENDFDVLVGGVEGLFVGFLFSKGSEAQCKA